MKSNKKQTLGLPKENNRYCVWVIKIIHQAGSVKALDFFDVSCKYLFQDYKIFQAILFNKKEENVKAEQLILVGKTPVRKRVTTLLNEFNAVAQKYEVHVMEDFNIIDMSYLVSYLPYEKTTIKNAVLVASSNRQAEYTGNDLRVLDLPEDRHEWQNKLLSLFYDEEKEMFVKPDDRTIHWVQDPTGSVGKSKMVKWLCMNRPDEVVKVVFGSAQQLRNSLITIGPRILYLIDIPRTPSEDEKFANMASSIEDLKNGHVVSHMYGKYSQLMMEPPHIIIFANTQCPEYLLSKDRWKMYEIKDLDQ